MTLENMEMQIIERAHKTLLNELKKKGVNEFWKILAVSCDDDSFILLNGNRINAYSILLDDWEHSVCAFEQITNSSRFAENRIQIRYYATSI